MDNLRLYERYDRDTALRLAGLPARARTVCDGQWVISRDVAVCLAPVGEAPRMSHFADASCFRWVADKPYRVAEGEYGFVPAEVTRPEGDVDTLHLFVRSPGSDRFLYLGNLEPAHVFELHWPSTPQREPDNYGVARFRLKPPLPSAVWTELGGLKPGSLDHSPVDQALANLRNPTTTEDRLTVLRALVEYWHGPIRPDDGLRADELGDIPMPRTLRWWYQWAGRRQEIMAGQNILLEPSALKISPEGLLIFYGENQWCYEWATEPEGDDPPIVGRENDSDPFQWEQIVLSEHLILACLFEAIMCHSPYGASVAWLPEEVLAEIGKHVPPIAVHPWGWASTRFYAKGGAFMYAMDNGEYEGTRAYSVWIGAKTEHPLQFLKPYLDDAWEYVAL